MGEIGVSELGKTLNSNKDTGELTPYLCSINIHWTCINLEEVKKTRFTKEEQRKYILLKNDLLVCEGGDIGRCFVWNFPIPMYYQNALHRIRFYNEINPFFFKFAIEYYKNIHILDKYSKGVTIKHLTKTALHSICFPLPPLLEQHRIVEKIEELLALVDDLETNKTDLQSYIKQAKSKVLEMAIRGELVPQNPEDEPASVLLERIKKEQKSSKSKGKTTEHNTHYEEELLFDIPENWVWCRLGEITMINPKNNIEDNKEVSFIPMTLISDGFSNKHSYEVRLWGEVKKGFTHFQEGDIGIAKITPCFENRKSVIFSNLVNEVGAGTTELHILRPFAYSEIKKYIYWFINTESFIQRGISHFSGAVGQQRVGKDILENTLIPLPPLSEQHRIVEKIEEIFSALEFIEESLI